MFLRLIILLVLLFNLFMTCANFSATLECQEPCECDWEEAEWPTQRSI
jgi:hypothetical protein